jgi:ribose 5-phosphate isomerase B
MKVAIGSDHAGFQLKNRLRDSLHAEGHEVVDLGTHSSQRCDYTDFAARVGAAVAAGEAERGVLVCGTGIGVSIAANKIHGIRAAAVSDPVSARMSREHNDANIVCFGERIVGPDLAEEIVHTFLATPFSEIERHARRIAKIAELETHAGE